MKEVTQYINELKNSNATGHDLFNSKMLKKVKHILAPHTTHLINCTIRTSKFPNNFKISRVLPLLKKSKNPNNPQGYRPISNLCVVEKIIEGHIKNT